MDIMVTFEAGKLRTVPERAVVKLGTSITWLFRAPQLAVPLARWTIYFNDGSPLRVQRGVSGSPLTRLRMSTRNTQLGTITNKNPNIRDLLKGAGVETVDVVDHLGVLGPVVADETGDYKYGVRLASVSPEKDDDVLDDDDPRLVVE